MIRNRLSLVIGLLVVLSMLLSACGSQPTPVPATEVPGVVPVDNPEPTAVPVRNGAWLDELIFTGIPEQANGIAQLEGNAIDIYAVTVSDADLYNQVTANPDLASTNSYGSFDAFMFNPAGPEFSDGRLNPFSNPQIREACNWLLDRNYMAEELVGNGAKPKTVALISAFPDYALYADLIRPVENKYVFNVEKAREQITTEMEAMGATLGADGKWQYKGTPVVIKGIIRTEDERELLGNYFADRLEEVGFTVDRQLKVRAEAAPLWQSSVPSDGEWSYYTAGWGYSAIVRDMGIFFDQYYNPRGDTTTTQQAYVVSPEFDEVSLKLATNAFTTMEERRQLFAQALTMSLQESQLVFAVDLASFTARNADLVTAYDLGGGVSFSEIWPYTMRWDGQEGGTARIAQSGVMVNPWNPIAGSNWVDDQMPIRSIQDDAVISDPYTGLVWPQRLERAEVVAREGLPISKSMDWITLDFVPQIDVPGDAWIDWDAANQKFITVGEKNPEGLTALTKTTVYYPSDLWTAVKWHDGSPITMGDFVLYMISYFDQAKTESPIYDPAQVSVFEALQTHFKGVRVVSTDPLVIETYDDLISPDAELMVDYTTTKWFPTTLFGPVSWHTFSLGYLAEMNNELAFSTDKATANNVTWTSYLAGPSLEILKKYLDQAAAESLIPYAPTLGQYVTAEEAAARYANLDAWYAAHGNMYLGTGLYYVDQAFPVEGTLVLKRNPDYPDPANKWDRFSNPKIAVADISGPTQVTIGQEATFDAMITFEDAPYPQADLNMVTYMVYDSGNNLIVSANAAAVADGHYQAVLSSEVTSKLVAGAGKIEFVVSPKVVSIPTFASREFRAIAP
jgi:peptide/nickel transport system substrate-binding protein